MKDVPTGDGFPNQDSDQKIGWLHLPAHAFWVLLFRAQQRRYRLRKNKRSVDAPRLAPGLRLQDVEFHSAALGRPTQYRVMLPENIPPGTHLPVVYLLHAAGDDFRGWSNDSNIAEHAGQGLILVMPEGGFSHYLNPVSGPQERYADFIVNELRADVEQRFPAATSRSSRAIAGVSMGGFGAIQLAASHPELYIFSAGISPALNVVDHPLSFRRLSRWLMLRRVFGARGSRTHNERNPFARLLSLDPATTPYFYLACGQLDHLAAPTKRIADLMQRLHLPHEIHIMSGSHNWLQWNAIIPLMLESLSQHLAD
jgi:S-formylglutathione hydrolase FrmB